MQHFRALRAELPDPHASGGWGLRPRPPKQPPHCEFLATLLLEYDVDINKQDKTNLFHRSVTARKRIFDQDSFKKATGKLNNENLSIKYCVADQMNTSVRER